MSDANFKQQAGIPADWPERDIYHSRTGEYLLTVCHHPVVHNSTMNYSKTGWVFGGALSESQQRASARNEKSGMFKRRPLTDRNKKWANKQ